MDDIKPIETYYNGYRFRSRLEARWAVFFDAMGIKYEYEPEGIMEGDTPYLPDFYLPEFHSFFEVKRDKFDMDKEEYDDAIKKISFGAYTNTFAGIIAFGDPVNDDLHIYCQESDDGGGGSYSNEITIGIHPETKEPYLFALHDGRERTFFPSFNNIKLIPMTTDEYRKYSYDDFVTEEVKQARYKARQARFEHGEKPII